MHRDLGVLRVRKALCGHGEAWPRPASRRRRTGSRLNVSTLRATLDLARDVGRPTPIGGCLTQIPKQSISRLLKGELFPLVRRNPTTLKRPFHRGVNMPRRFTRVDEKVDCCQLSRGHENMDFSNIFSHLSRFSPGAVQKTRTSTGYPTATSTLRVYQFRHDRIVVRRGG